MPSTIRDLTELTAVATDDYLLISDTSDLTNRDKRIAVSNLQSGVAKKIGTPVAGRVAAWFDANTVSDALINTSDIARLGTVQTLTALKTFSAGLNLGQATNLTYFDAGAWPSLPILSSSGVAPTVIYTNQDSFFMRLNTVCFFSFSIGISTISGGSANMRIPMPFTASALNQPRCFVSIDGVAMPGTAPFLLAFNVISGSNLGAAIVIQNNATFANMPISLFGAGDSIQASGFYYV